MVDRLRRDADKIWERCKQYVSVSSLKGRTKTELIAEIKSVLDRLPDIPYKSGGKQQLIDANFQEIMAEKLIEEGQIQIEPERITPPKPIMPFVPSMPEIPKELLQQIGTKTQIGRASCRERV